MRRIYIYCIVLVTVFFYSPNLFAKNLFTCNSSLKGNAYYHFGGVVNRDFSGWKEDGLSNYSVAISERNGEVDVLFKDSTGNIISAKADGAGVLKIGDSEDWLSVIAVYPNQTTEMFTFNFINNEISVSIHRYGDFKIKKSATFVGVCD
jgi:hypothetical protein